MKSVKKTIIVCFLFAWASIQAQESEAKKVVLTFFEGFHAQDTIKIKSVCHQDIQIQSVQGNEGIAKLTTQKPSDFLKLIATIPAKVRFEERLIDFKEQQDALMANVWTPYEFYVNGKLRHKGVNSFTLMLENKVWKIVHIIDTRIK
jgi:hypothetical protein